MDKEPIYKSGKILPIFLFGLLIVAGIYALAISRRKDTNQGPMNNTTMQGMDHGSMSPLDQSHRSYNLQLTSSTDNIKPGQPIKISYKIVNDKGDVLKDYTVAHEKLMHFIVVRKDLQNFQHLHPDFNQSTGEFTVSVNFPTEGPYRIFPDFTPTPENPQKLTVTVNQDINIGDMKKYQPQAAVIDKTTTKSVGTYNIAYSSLDNLQSQKQVDYELVVDDAKKLVTLEPYLGAMGHGVILKEGTLDFIHTHAGGAEDMPGMAMGSMDHMNHQGEPDTIDFSTTFPEPGIYRIFTQFQIKGKVITSDYTVNVK